MDWESPAVWVSSTLHCHSAVLAWQLSLWIRCELMGAKWQKGNQTVHISTRGFVTCVLNWPDRFGSTAMCRATAGDSSGNRPAYTQAVIIALLVLLEHLSQWAGLKLLFYNEHLTFLEVKGSYRSNSKTNCVANTWQSSHYPGFIDETEENTGCGF